MSISSQITFSIGRIVLRGHPYHFRSRSVCEEEEAEEAIEHRIHQSDEYYQEKVRPSRTTTDGELLRDAPKYDIDE